MMRFDRERYLKKSRQLAQQLLDGCSELYDVHIDKNGKITGIRVKKGSCYLNLKCGFGRIHRTEYCVVCGDELRFIRFSFHLEPEDPNVYKFRIDQESPEDGVHANPDSRLRHMKHKLRYPEDIGLNIEHFCLLYFIAIAFAYLRAPSKYGYPLFRESATLYNKIIGKLRKQVEK